MDIKRVPITPQTRVWKPNLDIAPPILGKDLPGFSRWVKWHGFEEKGEHKGYDFAAYLTKDNKCILGLPKETPVRAVADGKIIQISTVGGPYANFMTIEHNVTGSSIFWGLLSEYHHIVPLVEGLREVKKGEIIAYLHKDEGKSAGRLVHLHFELVNEGSVRPRQPSPEEIFPEVAALEAVPQLSTQFRVNGIEQQPKIVLSHFEKVLF